MMHFKVDYTPERHRAVEKIMTEMSADPEFPNNYNCMIKALQGVPVLPLFQSIQVQAIMFSCLENFIAIPRSPISSRYWWRAMR